MEVTDEDAVLVPEQEAYEFVRDAFVSAGVDGSVAKDTARGLWFASIRGVDSHGIRLLPHYIDEVQGGRINPSPEFEFEQTAGAIGRLDADHAFGHAAGKRAMEHAIEMADEVGAGHVVVANSSHCGSMAYFGLDAAKKDMIGYASTHSTSNTNTPNSTRPFFGNNPICVTAPMADEEPFCFDAAITPITFNEVKQRRDSGQQLPPGAAADENGEETLNPHEATQLLPIGDYKGFGLAMVGDIMNGLLSGMPVGRDISSMFGDPMDEHRRLGHYFSAVQVDAFVDVEEFKKDLQELAEDIREEPRKDSDTPVYVPGDPEKDTKAERIEEGIPVPDHILERFDDVAEEFDLEPLVEEY
jgi:ureidoglycolate dehydrogenase (NAD+)